jgi:citrate lyase beta subunit
MKHHKYNQDFPFVSEPIEFNKFTDKSLLQYCLGATLYMPGTQNIVEKILQKNVLEATSIVMDFEDAVDENNVSAAESSVLRQLDKIAASLDAGVITHDEIPLIFLRVRHPEQFKGFVAKLTSKQTNVLSGFAFPKFSSSNCHEYFDCLESVNSRLAAMLYGMPILEGKTIAYKELRTAELVKIKEMIEPYKDIILNIRIGGTDISSMFGVRRGIDYSIYDILHVKDCLSDVLNFFSREEDDYTISGPVWEYFLAHKEENLDNLLADNIHRSLLTRNPILNEAVDGLMREVILDKANGFVGKTIIHPSHAKFVNAMQTVIREEFEDALQIMETPGGVVKSLKGNKMNEINPHKHWAKKVISRAKAYGVIESEACYLKLILKY